MMAAVALMDEGTSLPRDPVVLVNMATQETVILHGDQAILQASIFLNQSNDMIGIRPPSTESIQVMREVATSEEDECSICLERIEGTAKEMSCRHRFHGDCIERWLRIHCSCPLCRFAMPSEELKTEEERWRRGVWVTISLGRGRIDRRGDDDRDSLRGFGRNILVIRHYGRFQSNHPLHKDKEMRREMGEMQLDDYDPDPKANPRNGPLLNSASPPPPPIHY